MLKQSDMNTIYKLVAGLVNEFKSVNSSLIGDKNGLGPQQVLDFTTKKVSSYFRKIDSHYKRTKLVTSQSLYVPPTEVGVGTRFELERDRQTNLVIPQRIQSTFEYVSIVDTIKSLFERDNFKTVYFKHNSENQSQHTCVEGVYERFCCGKKYKNSEFFQADKNRIQIQIGTDEFEPCNPLQSKAGAHKICAVYFLIRNMPVEFLSKLNNIYLICLCNSNDLKSGQTDYNNIWDLIAKDIGFLEENGIDIDTNINVKGTLAYMSFDNLGGNTSLGLVESFRAFFYCRICELPKEKCEVLTKEYPEMLRNKNNYTKQLAIVEASEKVNYSQTKGIKRTCSLNKINNFHIVENISVDIMHDLNEGVIPFLLNKLFSHCISMKVFTERQITKMIQFYDFGTMNSKNKPSKLMLEKKNCGQNGAQSRCLFLHLPFILSIFKTNYIFADLWICVKSLLKICQIAYSSRITDADLISLENEVSIHLESVKKCFKVKLTPKLHLLTHYSRVIRSMGPIVHMSMMRFESKHKYFKDCVKKSNNFMNINKSLALNHQRFMCKQTNSYVEEFASGSKKAVHEDFLNKNSEMFAGKKNDTCEVKWLRCNGIIFKKGLLILNESVLFEIVKILFVENNCMFFGAKYDNMRFDSYSNSYEIKQTLPINYSLIDFTKLLHKKPYEKKRCGEKYYIIADTLDLKNIV